MTLRNFVKQRPYLMWYIKNPEHLSDDAVVESVLNYGDFDDVLKMISVLGIKKVKRIFTAQLRRKRINYNPKLKHYFAMYFKKHA
ncbi:MAG: hypothetical protein HYT12_04455 [Candidatus Liptonbacteria bacterium]|nr:hypothetical protein [Candidatus Liptonbacteria bacterium]